MTTAREQKRMHDDSDDDCIFLQSMLHQSEVDYSELKEAHDLQTTRISALEDEVHQTKTCAEAAEVASGEFEFQIEREKARREIPCRARY